MIQDKIIITDNIEKYYDEESEAVLMNINNRKFCLKHKFINASLQWERNNYSIRLESKARKNFNPEWGTGYGGIRYCKRCKCIDCIHIFEPTKTYCIETNEFSGANFIISRCKICKRRILRGVYGYTGSLIESHKLINDVFQEHGMKSPLSKESEYGSGYFIELPLNVSRLLRDCDENAARAYIESVIKCGRIENFNQIKL